MSTYKLYTPMPATRPTWRPAAIVLSSPKEVEAGWSRSAAQGCGRRIMRNFTQLEEYGGGGGLG